MTDSPPPYNPMTDSPEKTLVDFTDMDVDPLPAGCGSENFTGSFPPEVWVMILDSPALVDRETMCRIALTSWSLNRIITPLLWKHVILQRPRVFSFASPPGSRRSRYLVHRASACARAIKKSNALAACVESFTLKSWFLKECGRDSADFEVVQEMNHAFDHLISAVLRCPNLRELELYDVQIPPRLHRALYHLHSLRYLSLSGCTLACRHETCAMNPSRLPITQLKLKNTTQSVHGYNHHFNTIRALGQASNLKTLTVDGSIFPQIMDMYITCGIPSTLTTLHAATNGSDDDSALFVTFAGISDNPLRNLSMREDRDAREVLWTDLAPTALPHLKSVAGGTKLIMRLMEGRGGLESVTLYEMSHPTSIKRLLEEDRGTLKRLSYPTPILQRSEVAIIAAALPGLEDLSIEYIRLGSDFWAEDGIPVVKPFPKLRTITIMNQKLSALGLQHEQDMPPRMLEEAGPLAWEAVCPDLHRITLTQNSSWRRMVPRLWAREVLADEEWRDEGKRRDSI
ncbi:hypothetical protein FRB94_001262 [Tulasnella sp. JGI-2019a]|nr:hypothetical protein FRB93_007848 [Tulasnella sp. JGI-2019a]KAG9013700.1 hypothetical protein FRB94_001262 [Tulasnella sp. JGI-2019a]KAG9037146.1 hypothetical protein FRB95_006700 [Tulasnella sp. JGI-2019a]